MEVCVSGGVCEWRRVCLCEWRCVCVSGGMCEWRRV